MAPLFVTVATVAGLVPRSRAMRVETSDSARGTSRYGTRSATPLLSAALAGVNSTMPATSRYDRPEPFDAPTVATGTVRLSWTWTSPRGGTVTDVRSTVAVCGDPALRTTATLKLAMVGPALRSVTV